MAETDAASGVTARAPRGRPRSADHDAAILEAAVELLLERGPDSASVEAIARRAGVAKLTVYRRWTSKDDLLIAAVEHARGPSPQPFGADASMEDAVQAMARQLVRPRFRHLAARMLGASVDRRELVQVYFSQHLEPRLKDLTEVARREITAGRFPPDSDPEVIRDMLFGVVGQLLLVEPSSTKDVEERLRGILRQAGYRPTPHGDRGDSHEP